MKTTEFLDQLERNSIVSAIQEAERKSSGQIRVFISRREPEEAVAAAKQRFLKLGMEKTQERNAVLIYVAPRVHKFAIIGDSAIHARCGDDFWREVSESMSGHFRNGKFTQGILHGIHRAGELLAMHFPRTSEHRNELPDEVEHD